MSVALRLLCQSMQHTSLCTHTYGCRIRAVMDMKCCPKLCKKCGAKQRSTAKNGSTQKELIAAALATCTDNDKSAHRCHCQYAIHYVVT